MEENHVCFIDIPKNDNKSRSISPMTPSPRYEKNLGFFHQLSRRFGRRSHDDMMMYYRDNDSRSSSTDSCSSSLTGGGGGSGSGGGGGGGGGDGNNHIGQIKNNRKSSLTHNSTFELSCENSSETSSTTDDHVSSFDKTPATLKNRLHRRSTSSFRRAIQNLSISSRSLSCSSTTMTPISLKNTNNTTTTTTTMATTKLKKTNSIKKQHQQQQQQQQPQQQPQRILRQPVSYTYLKGMSGLPTQRVPRSAICCHYNRR